MSKSYFHLKSLCDEMVSNCLMKYIVISFSVLLSGFANAEPQNHHETYNVATQVYFSPNGGAQQAIINLINGAKQSIFVQAYSFTNKDIVRALIEANKRGVSVFVILDKSNKTDKYSVADLLDHFGIDTYIDEQHAIAHNKIMIIDKETVITGSYNFTQAAETKNAENLLMLRSDKLADVYFGNWAVHQKHAVPYVGRDR